MGLKLEFILIFLVAVILSVALTVRIQNAKNVQKISTKELEFHDTTFTEVDTNKTIGVAYGTYGVRDRGVLTVQNFRYSNDDIKLLRSKTAIFKEEKIYMDHNVIMNQEEGSDYYTEHAVYDKKTEILDVTAPFKAVQGKNIMLGDTMRYWAKEKKVFSTNANAVIYTKEDATTE